MLRCLSTPRLMSWLRTSCRLNLVGVHPCRRAQHHSQLCGASGSRDGARQGGAFKPQQLSPAFEPLCAPKRARGCGSLRRRLRRLLPGGRAVVRGLARLVWPPTRAGPGSDAQEKSGRRHGSAAAHRCGRPPSCLHPACSLAALPSAPPVHAACLLRCRLPRPARLGCHMPHPAPRGPALEFPQCARCPASKTPSCCATQQRRAGPCCTATTSSVPPQVQPPCCTRHVHAAAAGVGAVQGTPLAGAGRAVTARWRGAWLRAHAHTGQRWCAPPRAPRLHPAGISEAACLNSSLWELFQLAAGEQGRALAQQGAQSGKPLTILLEGGLGSAAGPLGQAGGWGKQGQLRRGLHAGRAWQRHSARMPMPPPARPRRPRFCGVRPPLPLQAAAAPRSRWRCTPPPATICPWLCPTLASRISSRGWVSAAGLRLVARGAGGGVAWGGAGQRGRSPAACMHAARPAARSAHSCVPPAAPAPEPAELAGVSGLYFGVVKRSVKSQSPQGPTPAGSADHAAVRVRGRRRPPGGRPACHQRACPTIGVACACLPPACPPWAETGTNWPYKCLLCTPAEAALSGLGGQRQGGQRGGGPAAHTLPGRRRQPGL